MDNKYLPTDLIFQNSISINRFGNTGTGSSAIGLLVEASGEGSHAEGSQTIASDFYSHAEGTSTTASGYCSHAEGTSTTASGNLSHAEGESTTASGYASHAEGCDTKASSDYQHVQGQYNIEDAESKYAHIVGNGTSNTSRSNAHTVDWDGNAWYQGDVYVGGTNQSDGKKLLSTADIYFDTDGNLCVTINGTTKKFTPIE